MNFENMVAKLSHQQDHDFYFIQAGACDGDMADPLAKFIRRLGWKGIFLEPYDFYMSILEQNYSDIKERFVFENSALSTHSSERIFHNISPEYTNPIITTVSMAYGDILITTGIDLQTASSEQLADWSRPAKIWNPLEHLRGQGSFYKGKVFSAIIHLKNKNRVAHDVFKDFDINPDKYIHSSIVKCKTINDLIEENDIKKIDLLATDIQGHDAELLLTLDSFLIKPKIIYFESHMIDEKDKKNLLEVFRNDGYEGNFSSDSPDSFFYQPNDTLD